MVEQVILEKFLRRSLCEYPELIDDRLFGTCPGMEVLGEDHPILKEHDPLPNGRQADIVFVERERITVVETKKGLLSVSDNPSKEDVVDQIADYLQQCRIKYPDKLEYRGFIVGTGIADKKRLELKLSSIQDIITPLIFGQNIPSVIRICAKCHRAVSYESQQCVCRAIF